MNDFGKKQWLIADGYMSDTKNGDFVSDERQVVFEK